MTKEGLAFLERERPDICIFGHTHQLRAEWFGKTLLFNPGSARPKWFTLPRGSGMVKIGDRLTTQHIRLRERLEEFLLLRCALRKSWFSRPTAPRLTGRRGATAGCAAAGSAGFYLMKQRTFHSWVRKSPCPNHSNGANPHPEHVEDSIGHIFPNHCAPGEHYRVHRIESPNKKKRALRAKPTYQRKAEDSHQHPDHLDGFEIPSHYWVQPVN